MRELSVNFRVNLPDCVITSKEEYVDHEFTDRFKTVGSLVKYLNRLIKQQPTQFKYQREQLQELHEIVWCLNQYDSNTNIEVSN